MLNQRQKMFVDEYLITGNVYQSAIKAGYSENYAKGNSVKLFENESRKKYLDERLKEIESQKIADAAEVMRYLTSVMRNETREEVPMVVSNGDWSEIQIVKKDTSIKDRNKAAEMLAKRFGILTDKISLDIAPVVIKDDVTDED